MVNAFYPDTPFFIEDQEHEDYLFQQIKELTDIEFFKTFPVYQYGDEGYLQKQELLDFQQYLMVQQHQNDKQSSYKLSTTYDKGFSQVQFNVNDVTPLSSLQKNNDSSSVYQDSSSQNQFEKDKSLIIDNIKQQLSYSNQNSKQNKFNSNYLDFEGNLEHLDYISGQNLRSQTKNSNNNYVLQQSSNLTESQNHFNNQDSFTGGLNSILIQPQQRFLINQQLQEKQQQGYSSSQPKNLLGSKYQKLLTNINGKKYFQKPNKEDEIQYCTIQNYTFYYPQDNFQRKLIKMKQQNQSYGQNKSIYAQPNKSIYQSQIVFNSMISPKSGLKRRKSNMTIHNNNYQRSPSQKLMNKPYSKSVYVQDFINFDQFGFCQTSNSLFVKILAGSFKSDEVIDLLLKFSKDDDKQQISLFKKPSNYGSQYYQQEEEIDIEDDENIDQ